MSRPQPGRHTPAGYEIRLAGHLDQHWSTWFAGLSLVREDNGTTTLRGMVADQAELHGLLARVRDLGLTLLSVTSDQTSTPGDLVTGPSVQAKGADQWPDHQQAEHEKGDRVGPGGQG